MPRIDGKNALINQQGFAQGGGSKNHEGAEHDRIGDKNTREMEQLGWKLDPFPKGIALGQGQGLLAHLLGLAAVEAKHLGDQAQETPPPG